MFWDPVQNPMGWEVKKLGDICTKISDGVHAKPEYTATGKPFISVVNINSGKLLFDDCKYVSEEAYEKMIKSTHPEKGDILYTKVGATYGIPALVDTDRAFCLYVSVALLKPKSEIVNSQFLTTSMAQPYIKNQADKRIKGIGVPDLHLNQIREFEVLVPPLELQNQFNSFVQQIDKSKFEMAIYEKLWYNYQIWRKKMGLFRGILDLFSTWTISDKLGLGAGFLYADYAWEKANERELNKMKAGVTQTISNYINENRKLLNNDLIQTLNNYINSIANCNKFNANSILSELKNFLMHKCAYHSCIIEILNHSIEAIESIPEDNLDDGVKIQALQKTKNVIDCSDSNQLPILLKDLFSFYDENGIEVENKEELFDKFESLRKEYLA